MNFIEKLQNATQKNNSRVCVGLDIDPLKLPEHLKKEKDPVLIFAREIIDATKDLVNSYKPNMAFYEALGINGLEILKKIMAYIPKDIPVVLDAKRGDIGNTAAMYAKSIFEDFNADATTLHPYMGFDSVQPFLAYKDKMSFILCLTSNPGSADFQKQKIGEEFVYQAVARKCLEWNVSGNIGLVVGATNADELKVVRELCPSLPFLIPGVGAQGGSLEAAVNYGLMLQGKILINSSREILFASNGLDFVQAARGKAIAMRDKINAIL